MKKMFLISAYGFIGAILFTVGMWYLPVVWWVKVLIWVGVGMLINTNSLLIKHLSKILTEESKGNVHESKDDQLQRS